MLRSCLLMIIVFVSGSSCLFGQKVKGEFSFSIFDVRPARAEVYERYGLENGQVLSGEFVYDLQAPPVDWPSTSPIAHDVKVYLSDYMQLSLLDSEEIIVREEGLPLSITQAGSGGGSESALADGFVIGSGFTVDALNLASFQIIGTPFVGPFADGLGGTLPSGPADLDLDSNFAFVLDGWDIAGQNQKLTLSIVPEPSSFSMFSLWSLVAILVVARRGARRH